MIDDGLFERFPKPDVILGQHVMVWPAGMDAGRSGAITSAADSLQIHLFGRGAHGSMPQASVDPVVMAASTVLRLQTIVSREVAAAEATGRLADAFRNYFSDERVRTVEAAPASEDFGSFGTEWGVPSVFWFVGGTDPDAYAQAKADNRVHELPTNHSPQFLPVLHPTLATGVDAMVVAACGWLAA